jgi:uncharacterized membrane protein YvbJ
MSKLCNVCGNPCEDSSIYCPICGSPLPTSQPQVQYTQPQVQNIQPQVQYTQPQEKKSHKKLFIILGIAGGATLLIILLVVILFSILIRNYNHTYSSTPSATSGSTYHHTNTSYERYETENHEYYYPAYDNADLSSEEYIDWQTE